MRTALIAGIVVALLFSAAHAQIIQIQAQGTISFISGTDSSVQIGTPFTLTFTLDTSTPLSSSGMYTPSGYPPTAMYNYWEYQQLSDVSVSENFGDYALSFQSEPLTEIDAFPVTNDPGSVNYLFFLDLSSDSSSNFAEFESDSVTVPSSATVPTVAIYGKLPEGYFLNESVLFAPSADATAVGSVTSFTIQPIPEPSTYGLVALSLLLLAVRKRVGSFI
jgi:hypothetical protein